MSQAMAAVVNASGVYIGMFGPSDVIADDARRLPQIQECDLPIGRYFWVDDQSSPFQGFFWPISKKLVIAPGVK